MTLITMWILGWVAALGAVFRRLLLGPTMPSWTWRTEVTIAVTRQLIATASTRSNGRGLGSVGLKITAPVPRTLRRDVDVRRVRVGSVEADRYIPSDVFQASTTLLYFHGGGYVFGNPGTHRQFIAQLVHATGAGAVAPRYRLAPKHRYPAAVDDAQAAYEALLAAGIDPARIVVAGDSAGGGLAVALLLRIRRLGLPVPAGAILFSPYVDLSHTGYTIRTNARTDYLPEATMLQPNDAYADPGQMTEPEVSPVVADLTGLPPMLVFAGGAEMILSDSIRLVENARRDGVEAELVVEPEMMHVWPAIVEWEPASHRCLETSRRWLDDLASVG